MAIQNVNQKKIILQNLRSSRYFSWVSGAISAKNKEVYDFLAESLLKLYLNNLWDSNPTQHWDSKDWQVNDASWRMLLIHRKK